MKKIELLPRNIHDETLEFTVNDDYTNPSIDGIIIENFLIKYDYNFYVIVDGEEYWGFTEPVYVGFTETAIGIVDGKIITEIKIEIRSQIRSQYNELLN